MIPRAFFVFLVALILHTATCDEGSDQQGLPQHTEQQQQLTQDNFLQHQDIGHIRHDIKDQYYVELGETVNERELDFYNFRLHDYDSNLLLDGLELLFAINHDVETPSKAQVPQQTQPGEGQQQIEWHAKFDNDAIVIDQILKDYDKDQDGYISFYEYMEVRRKYRM